MSDDGKCPNVTKCELFPKLKTDAALGFCLDMFCHSNFTTCARYRYAKEHQAKPPITLLPTGRDTSVD